MAKSTKKKTQNTGRKSASPKAADAAPIMISDGFFGQVAATPKLAAWINRGANKQPHAGISKDTWALCCLVRALSRGWQHGAFQDCSVWNDLVSGKLKSHRIERGSNGRVMANSIWWQLNQQICDRYLDPLFPAGVDDVETALMLACDRAGGWPSEEEAPFNTAMFHGITGGGDGAHFPVHKLMPLYVYAKAPLFDQKVAQAARGLAPLFPEINAELAAGMARVLASQPAEMAAFLRAKSCAGRVEALRDAFSRCQNHSLLLGIDIDLMFDRLDDGLARAVAADERRALAEAIGLDGGETAANPVVDAGSLLASNAASSAPAPRRTQRL